MKISRAHLTRPPRSGASSACAMRSRTSSLLKRSGEVWSSKLRASESKDRKYSTPRVKESPKSILQKVSNRLPYSKVKERPPRYFRKHAVFANL